MSNFFFVHFFVLRRWIFSSHFEGTLMAAANILYIYIYIHYANSGIWRMYTDYYSNMSHVIFIYFKAFQKPFCSSLVILTRQLVGCRGRTALHINTRRIILVMKLFPVCFIKVKTNVKESIVQPSCCHFKFDTWLWLKWLLKCSFPSLIFDLPEFPSTM